MKLTLAWEEFVDAALRDIRIQHSISGRPRFEKDYGCYDGIGEAYDLPDFVVFELTSADESADKVAESLSADLGVSGRPSKNVQGAAHVASRVKLDSVAVPPTKLIEGVPTLESQ